MWPAKMTYLEKIIILALFYTKKSARNNVEKFVDRKRLCFVCLQPGHTEDTCSRTKNRCESCQVPHSELLPHTDDRPEVFVDTMTNFVRIVRTHRARRGGINYPFFQL